MFSHQPRWTSCSYKSHFLTCWTPHWSSPRWRLGTISQYCFSCQFFVMQLPGQQSHRPPCRRQWRTRQLPCTCIVIHRLVPAKIFRTIIFFIHTQVINHYHKNCIFVTFLICLACTGWAKNNRTVFDSF